MILTQSPADPFSTKMSDLARHGDLHLPSQLLRKLRHGDLKLRNNLLIVKPTRSRITQEPVFWISIDKIIYKLI